MESLRVNNNNRRENGWMHDGWVGGRVEGFSLQQDADG